MSYTTVTAKLLTTSGAVPPDASFVKFQLRGFGLNLPRVVGTNVIVDSIEVDAYPDNTGSISITLVDNFSIDPPGTFYHISFFEGGELFRELDWTITGASVDLSTATPTGGCLPGVAPPTPCLCGYSIVISFTGQPLAGQVIVSFAMPNLMIFPLNFLDSTGMVNIAPLADAVFVFNKNGVPFGSVTFSAGQAVGVFGGAVTHFDIGDVFSLVAPTPADANLTDLNLTLKASSV